MCPHQRLSLGTLARAALFVWALLSPFFFGKSKLNALGMSFLCVSYGLTPGLTPGLPEERACSNACIAWAAC